MILAATVFFHGSGGSAAPASLFDAHDLIRENVGKGTCSIANILEHPLNMILSTAAAMLFALALLAAGQSSSIIATVAGQCVSEGFLRWNISVSAILYHLVQRPAYMMAFF